MKDVFIHGSDDGQIRWVEDTSSNLSSNSCEWNVEVRFCQHPESKKDVYVTADGGDVTFTLDDAGCDGPLRAKAVELTPNSAQKVVLQPKGETSQGTQQGQRWYGGYVQKA